MPPIPPHKALILAIKITLVVKVGLKELIAKIGAIFCQVKRMKAGSKGRPAITGGNQK